MNELAVIDQAELDTALAKVDGLTEFFNLPTTAENAQAKKDASLELSKIAKLLDSKRADAVKPALEEQRRINGIFKPVMDKLESMSKGLIGQVQKFVNDEKQKEAEERARIAKEQADKLIAGEKFVAIDQSYGKDQTAVQPPIPTVSETKIWTYEIMDVSLIPRAYMEPSDKAISDAVKAGTRSIPGVRIYQETRVGRR